MGRRVSWISVASKATGDVLTQLGLTDSGQVVTAGAVPIAGARMANGSFVIVFDEFWHPMIEPLLMKVLSLNCIVVGCAEDENSNTSVAFLCRDGKRVWQVSHLRSEGDDHLAIEGAPPRAVTALMHAALKARAEHGHDAVFGVPAGLAHEFSGFRYGEQKELVFSRLDRKFADIDATREEIVRVAEGVLATEGYVQDAGSGGLFVKTTAEDRIKVGLQYSTVPEAGLIHFGMRFDVCNRYVHGFMQQASDLYATETAVLHWYEVTDTSGSLSSPSEVAAYISHLRLELPPFLRRLHDIVALEALVNGRPRYDAQGEVSKCHYDGDTGYSSLILAYLAANPNFDEWVTQTDFVLSRGKPNPASDVNKIRAHLKAHVSGARPPEGT